MKGAVLSATEAARGFGELLARVRYRRESFLIRRGRVIVARLGPIDVPGVSGAEAAKAWANAPHLGRAEATELARDLRAVRKTVSKRIRSPWER